MGIETAALAEQIAEYAASGELAEACFGISSFTYPGLDVAPYRARFDELADLVEGTGHLDLRRVVAIREGYGGSVDDYQDPANSHVHLVLDSRHGLPITLSVIWMEVGRRAGIAVEGVGLPGHFLIYADGQLVDPYHGGEAIGSDEAASLVAQTMGGPPRLNPDWLQPIGGVEMVERILRNFQHSFQHRGELERAPWIDDCLKAIGVETAV